MLIKTNDDYKCTNEDCNMKRAGKIKIREDYQDIFIEDKLTNRITKENKLCTIFKITN